MRSTLLTACGLGAALLLTAAANAPAADQELAATSDPAPPEWPAMLPLDIGRSARGAVMWCWMDETALDNQADIPRVLMVCEFDGAAGWRKFLPQLNRLRPARSATQRPPFLLAVIPADAAVVGAARGAQNEIEGELNRGFPPPGPFYSHPDARDAQSLWRFIAWFAPDVVVEVQDESHPDWQRAIAADAFADTWPADSLTEQLRTRGIEGFGRVPAVRSVLLDDERRESAARLYGGFARLPGDGRFENLPRSPLRAAASARLSRTPDDIVEQLLAHYGDHLNSVMYQPAMSLIARLRWARQRGDRAQQDRVAGIVEPFVHGAPTFPSEINGAQIAGHLVFAELAAATGDPQYVALVRRAADLAFDERGRPRDAMPTHAEMSDAVFMACPILCAAGRLTGETRYFEMARTHLQFMQRLCLREDGLYRHSPECEAAWGRGNGFPALGLALSLSEVDAALAAGPAATELNAERLAGIRAELLDSFRAHLSALVTHQDVTGMWRQVIDEPGSYRELSCTCMITVALLRGIAHGWLEPDPYRPVVARAWEAIKLRIGADGVLFDVCTGTGKQPTLEDYFHREAILGVDERGGAMALLAAVEMAAWTSRP